MKSIIILVLFLFQLTPASYYPSLPKSAVKKMDKTIAKTFESNTIQKISVQVPEDIQSRLTHEIPGNALFILVDTPESIGPESVTPESVGPDDVDPAEASKGNIKGDNKPDPEGTSKGILYLASAKGRHDFFDYMVIFNNDLSIRKIQVLVYRSDHGHEITGKGWLKQFTGRDGCRLEYGQDVQAISGATYSGKSITADISRLCESLKELRSLGVL